MNLLFSFSNFKSWLFWHIFGIKSIGNPVLEVSEVLERCHGDVSFRHCSLLNYFNLKTSKILKYAYKKLSWVHRKLITMFLRQALSLCSDWEFGIFNFILAFFFHAESVWLLVHCTYFVIFLKPFETTNYMLLLSTSK
jgi:hypothetical protein